MNKKIPRLVWIAFFMTLLGVLMVLTSYVVDSSEKRVTLATSGLVLVIVSIVLRWTYRFKPGWFEKKQKS
jgi:drug/metabolite transporter (DMT)-like permease